jgi:hypothetical protein
VIRNALRELHFGKGAPLHPNPAARLFTFLNAAASESSAKSIRQIFAKLFEIEGQDTVEFLVHYCKFLQLTVDAETAVRETPGIQNHEKYLEPVRAARAAFRTLQLDSQYQEVVSQFGQVQLARLELVAERLGELGGEEAIPADTLERLLAEVRKLREVVDSDEGLDRQLRLILSRLLQKMEGAIVDYRIVGPEGIRAAYNESIGAVMSNQDLFKKESQSSSVKRWWKTTQEIGTAVGVALKLKELAAPYVHRLLEAMNN